MNIFQAAVLGVVEGVTEYLPISSTFHLIWAGKLLGLGQTEFQKLFEIVIQSGAILSILVLYLQTFYQDQKLVKKIAVSFIPTAAVGFLLYKVIKNVFLTSFSLQLAVFALVGVLFIVFEKARSGKSLTRDNNAITYKEALFVGLIQSLAVIPGVSRAGAVILALMFLGVKRSEAAKYSFLLAVPTLLAASALDLLKSGAVLLAQPQNISLLLVGFVTSFLSALVVVKWFISYLQKNTITAFGWYRIILSVILFKV